jgi:hypothetical protein
MREYEEYTEEVKRKRQIARICPACGKRNKTDLPDWDVDHHISKSVNISIEHRESYGGSGSSETRSYDICPECFDKHVVPLMESLSVPVEESSFDY